MAPRRKITRIGGNLPLVAQFRFLCCPGLLTMQHSFLFLFLFPLSFPPISSSLFFFPFLFFSSLSPFLSSIFFPSSSFSSMPYKLNWSTPFIAFKGAMHVDTWHARHAMCHSHGSPCVTHMVRRVSPTWFAVCHPHGSPCVTHMVLRVSSTWLAMCCPTSVASKYVKF